MFLFIICVGIRRNARAVEENENELIELGENVILMHLDNILELLTFNGPLIIFL